MRSVFVKYCRMVGFALLLGVKVWFRVAVFPLVAAFGAVQKEAIRTQAEIDAYLAKEFGDVPRSGKR